MSDASNPPDVQAIVEDMFEHPLFRPWRSDEAVATVKAAIMEERDACARISDLRDAIERGFDDLPAVDGACDWADVANLRDELLRIANGEA
jgi:hypothetical protein